MKFKSLALAAMLLSMAQLAASASIQFDGTVFTISGWRPTAEPAAGWSSIFTVYSGGGEAWADVPPVFGSYEVQANALTFRPRFSISPGLGYRAVFREPG